MGTSGEMPFGESNGGCRVSLRPGCRRQGAEIRDGAVALNVHCADRVPIRGRTLAPLKKETPPRHLATAEFFSGPGRPLLLFPVRSRGSGNGLLARGLLQRVARVLIEVRA